MITVNLDNSRSREYFITQLKTGGIDVILRRNDKGFIYGLTYIDHKSKCVFNGSDLGKDFSAAMIRDKWEVRSGGSSTVAKEVQQYSTQLNTPELSPSDSKNTLLDELTGSSSGFNPQVPYQFRKKRKRKNRKI